MGQRRDRHQRVERGRLVVQIPGFITEWVDGRIAVGVTTAMNVLLSKEDQILSNAAGKFRSAILSDIEAIPQAAHNLLTGELQAIPGQVGQIESAGLSGLEGIVPQLQNLTNLGPQLAQLGNIPQQIAGLPAEVVAQIGNLLPHFIRYMADMDPRDREDLFRSARGIDVSKIPGVQRVIREPN